MAKYLLEDMVRDKRERMRAKKAGRESEPRGLPKTEKTKLQKLNDKIPTAELKTKNGSRYYLWFVALISVIFCFFAVSLLFAKAKISVNPKTQDLALNEDLSAGLSSDKDANNGLVFDLVAIPGEESKILQASEKKDVATKATGAVVLYNAYNTSPQALSVDTRLEGSNGKIYKTQVKTTVPGMSKTGTPGSVEVKIYGAETGSGYNSAPLDFKILGFKGTAKYSKFYGRSKGPIAGGFKGKVSAVSDTEKAIAVNDLKIALQAKLLQKAAGQIPDGFILFKDAIFLDTDDSNISATNNKDNSLTLVLPGTLYGLLFDEQELTKKIVGNNIKDYDGSEIYLSNIKDLVFTLADKNNISFEEVKNINFNLSGKTKIVWKLDENKFVADLLGKSKGDFNQILSQYPNIDSAELTLSPMWKMSIPGEAKNVKVTVNYPK